MAPKPNIKVSKALSAMRAIGIPEETVKPVLKSLLKVYDKNWELIEEENYRALADAIFEYEEDKEEEEGKKLNEDLNVDHEPPLNLNVDHEPPLKRLRLKHQDQVSPSSLGNSGSLTGQTSFKKPKLEENPMEISTSRPPQLFPRDKTAEHEAVSPELHLRDKRKECTSPLNFSQAHFRGKGKEPISPQVSSREKRPVSKGSSGICIKEPNVEPGIVLSHREKFPTSRHANALIKPKMEPLTDDLPQLEVPIAVIHPLDSGPRINGDPIRKDFNSGGSDSVSKKYGDEPMVSQNANGKYERGGGSHSTSKTAKRLELANTPKRASTDIEIASSTLGEVKVSVSCSSILGQSNFHMPSLDTVQKMMEERCLRSYKIIEPKFSLKKLMEELCRCVLEAGSDSVDENAEKVTSIGSLKKSCIRNVLGSKGNFNILPNLCSSSKVVIPKIPRLLPMDGLGDLHSHIPKQKVIGRTVCGKIKNKDLASSQCSNSHSLVVYQPTPSSLDDIRPLHDVNDLSKGEERVRISLINENFEISTEPYPPSFYYIPQSIVYQDAYINFSLARIGDEDCCSKCFGDCVSSPIPCACARETGGEFAYTIEGLVNTKFLDECISMIRDPQKNRLFYCKDCPLERSKPCKGHLVRKFIKECWSKCGCSKQCGNRVVQRGITCNLQVFLTPERKGWGLRTLEDLPRGTFICEYVGEILTNTELYDRNIRRSTGNERHTYPVLLDADWGSEGVLKDEEALCLDATHYGNVARFINHRCSDANLIEIPVEVETPDHHYYHLAFFTTRNVDAMEELTWDYGIDFDDHNHPIKAFHCCCGSEGCRCKKHTESKSKALVLY